MAVKEPAEPPIPAPTFAGVDHFRLNVQDIQRSLAWYREVLGFDEPWYLGETAILRHPQANLELVLRPRGASTAAPNESSFDHLAFRVRDRVALEAWQARLRGLGIVLPITPAVGGTSINIEDPDGHDLELFVRDWDRPPSLRHTLADQPMGPRAPT